jgi:short-subunit dehydrogenase
MTAVAEGAALVTGASSGIGAALARRLARDGKPLVLTARRLDRLEGLADELRSRHHLPVTVISNDLARAGGPAALVEELDRRGIGVDWLVNNAGFGSVGLFHRLPLERELEEIRVNARAPLELTGRLLPAMVRRGRGVVLNVSSMAAFGPMPYSATYAATKAFLLSFSEALMVELDGTGVRVVCVCPGFTRTEFQEKAGVDPGMVPASAWMSAEAVADQAVRAATKSGVLVNGVVNSALASVMRLAPRALTARLAAFGMRGRI